MDKFKYTDRNKYRYKYIYKYRYRCILLKSLCTFVICRLESTLGREGDGGKGVALIGNLCNALVISFFGEGGFTILTFGSILGFLEEALLARAFLFSGEVGGGEVDCF